MESMYFKIFLYSIGSLLAIFGIGIKYMLSKLSEIVSEEEVRRMIDDQAKPQDIQLQIINTRLSRIEDYLYRLLEKRDK